VPWRPVEETKGDAEPPQAAKPASSPTAAVRAPAQTETWDEPETAGPAEAAAQAGQPIPQAAQPPPPGAPPAPQAVRVIPPAAQPAPIRNGG
jgi:hypothetical protein